MNNCNSDILTKKGKDYNRREFTTKRNSQTKIMKRKLVIQDNKTAVVALVIHKQKVLLLNRN
ncbi:hypothetical protein LCGC14_1796590, partial [marine sediment metagenome]